MSAGRLFPQKSI